METSRVINLSELCYGLGKVISDELQAFFKESTEDICNGLRNNANCIWHSYK